MKRHARPVALALILALGGTVALRGAKLGATDATVGQNLETEAKISLDKAAPSGGLEITVVSSDAKHLLFSRTPDAAGSESIKLAVRAGGGGSPEFYIQGLGESGTVAYTAAAPGYDSATGTVTLRPAGIVIAGPSKFGNPITTTPRAWLSKLTVYSAQLDSAQQFAGLQLIRGDLMVVVHVSSSDAVVGTVPDSELVLAGGSFNATTQFQPRGAGTTKISVDVPAGFSAPAQFTSVVANVVMPGIGLMDPTPLGENLQVGGAFLLGEPAPPGGLQVTLSTNHPSQLLVAATATDLGSKSVTIRVPEGGRGGSYFLQGLTSSGTATYSASAPGYRSREGIVNLTPSGVLLIGPTGPPDEAEALRPEAPVGPHGFFASLSKADPTPIVVSTAYLDPRTHRAADITLQPLRPGISLTVELESTNPAVGTVGPVVTIGGGSGSGGTEFVPQSAGTTVISALTPHGFTTPSNATSLDVIVKP